MQTPRYTLSMKKKRKSHKIGNDVLFDYIYNETPSFFLYFIILRETFTYLSTAHSVFI